MYRNQRGQFQKRANNPIQDLLSGVVLLLNWIITVIKLSPLLLFLYVIYQHFNIKKILTEIFHKTICNCMEEKSAEKPGYF